MNKNNNTQLCSGLICDSGVICVELSWFGVLVDHQIVPKLQWDNNQQDINQNEEAKMLNKDHKSYTVLLKFIALKKCIS